VLTQLRRADLGESRLADVHHRPTRAATNRLCNLLFPAVRARRGVYTP
jgi:hypothetical protein